MWRNRRQDGDLHPLEEVNPEPEMKHPSIFPSASTEPRPRSHIPKSTVACRRQLLNLSDKNIEKINSSLTNVDL